MSWRVIVPWVIGLIFSIGLGLVTGCFVNWLRHTKLGLPKRSDTVVPPPLTGSLERLFFTILVGLNVPGFPIAMMAWLAVKMATNWNRPTPTGGEPRDVRLWSFSGLLGGLVSMLFALLGGFICQGGWWSWIAG